MNLIIQFALLGAFLGSLVYAFIALKNRKPNNMAYTIGLGLALAGTFLLFWTNGAVGLIGSEDNDANVMYAAVLAISFFGSLFVQFQPTNMARVMFTAGVVQILIPIIAQIIGVGSTEDKWPLDIIMITSFFLCFWFGSAFMFRTAAKNELQAKEEKEAKLED